MAEQKEAAKTAPISGLHWVLAIIFFVVAYAVMFLIGSAREAIASGVANIPIANLFFPWPLVYDVPANPIWQVSMMNLLMPVVGFWLVFFFIDWVQEYFETKHAKTIVFPIIFAVFCLAAFFVSIYWMAFENSVLSGRTDVTFNYWQELQNSAFSLFMISGLFGWLARIAIEKIKL